MNVKTIEFIPAPRVTVSNRNWKEVRKYMAKGFCVCERETGTITLEKDSKILVTIVTDNGEEKTVNLRDRLTNFYGKEFRTEEICEIFQKDLENKIVQIIRSEYGLEVVKM